MIEFPPYFWYIMSYFVIGCIMSCIIGTRRLNQGLDWTLLDSVITMWLWLAIIIHLIFKKR